MEIHYRSIGHRIRSFFRDWKAAMDRLTAIQFEEPWREDLEEPPRHLRW